MPNIKKNRQAVDLPEEDTFDPTVASVNTYQESDAVKAAREAMEGYAGSQPDPYSSDYTGQIDDLYDQIVNRGQFQYDAGSDPLYQQYKNQYINLGDRAMRDTMGQAAALTGGYGSSYAQNVGQQAYGTYLQQLTDKIPELYNLALNKYNAEGDRLREQYGMLTDRENQQYSRWADDYNRWLTERDYATSAYNDAYNREYQRYRDDISDEQWQKEFDERVREYNETMAYNKSKSSGGGSGRSGGGSGGSKSSSSGGYATSLSAAEYEGAAAAARKGGSALYDYCNEMMRVHNLSTTQRDDLYDRYYRYTPDAASDAYAGNRPDQDPSEKKTPPPGATGYYV